MLLDNESKARERSPGPDQWNVCIACRDPGGAACINLEIFPQRRRGGIAERTFAGKVGQSWDA